MRRGLLISLLAIWLSGCNLTGANRPTGDGSPQVVTTSTMITDWTGEVAGEGINLRGILQPGVDPHVYEPVPADTQAFETADLILYNGYNLEPALIRLMNATGVEGRTFAVGEVVPPLALEEDGELEPDPHVWGDVRNVIQMVEAIRDQLIELSPENTEQFTENAERYTEELQNLDAWIRVQIETIPPNNRRLVTTHDAFQYYANAYGLEIVGTLIGISTEEQPSAQTVRQLVQAVQQAQVPAIFAETTINPALIRTVAEEANVRLAEEELYSDSIGAPGSDADSYIRMMVSNTRTLVENLGGTYQSFEDFMN